jgi:hypothetical protein
MADEIRHSSRPGPSTSLRASPSAAARALVYGMFLLIVVVTLWVPFYNRIEPTWHGIPFFYWFQMCWIVVTAVATVLAYRLKV